jgi:hypothetical protein
MNAPSPMPPLSLKDAEGLLKISLAQQNSVAQSPPDTPHREKDLEGWAKQIEELQEEIATLKRYENASLPN